MKMKKKAISLLNNNICLSLMINSFFLLLVILFCDMKYEVSDDFIMDSVLSGAYGNGYDEHLLFSNILLGYFLKGLYSITGSVSWYFIGHIFVCYISLCTISYVILENSGKIYGILICFIFVSFFSDDLYILVQFTKTATAATCAGGIFIIHQLWVNNRRRLWGIMYGFALALIGTMIRFQCVYIVAVFLFIMFLEYIIKYSIDKSKIVDLIKKICVCIVMLLLMVFVNRVNINIWNQNSIYGEYMKFSSTRASVVDVLGYGYESVEEEFGKIGLTLTDYCMIDSWNIVDRDYFTDEKLHYISDVKKKCSNLVNHDIATIVDVLYNRKYIGYTIFWGCVLLWILKSWRYKQAIAINTIKVLAAFSFVIYFIYRGRVVYRVDYSILFCLAATIGCSTLYKERNYKCKWIFPLVVLLIVCKIPLYIPDTNYIYMDDREYQQYIYNCFIESWNFNIKKYRCNVSKRKPHENLINMMMSDDENYYLVDFATGIQLLYYNYKPWKRIPSGYFQKYSYLGGVSMRYPDEIEVWKNKGIDEVNPNKALINDNIYVVDNSFKDTKMWYLREKYYPAADVEIIDEVDGFYILKYKKQED